MIFRWQEKARKFVTWAFEQLFDHQAALDYLLSRGLTEDTITHYGLGWNPGEKGKDLYRARESWGLPKVKKDDGRERPLWLPVGWVIPFFADKKIQKIRIRRRPPLTFRPKMKYYFVPGGVYVTTVINPERKAHAVVESELDAVLLAQEAGDLIGSVALGSVSTRPDEEAARILRQSPHILVALDFDGPGAKEWHWWKNHFPEAVRWPPPKGKDPGEAFEKGVDLRRWVLAGLPEGMR